MIRRFLLAMVALSGVAVINVAQAEELVDKRWYVAPYGTFVKPAGARGTDTGWGAGMAFGKMLNKHFNFEVKGFYQGLNNSNGTTTCPGGYDNFGGGEHGGGEHGGGIRPQALFNHNNHCDGGTIQSGAGTWDMTGATADIQYFISRGTFSPYTVIGLGGMNTTHNGRSAAGFIGEAGAGLTYEVTDNFLIRSDVRYRYNNNFGNNLSSGPTEFNDMLVNLGFVVPFGAKPKEEVVVAVAPVPVPPAPVVVATPDCSTLDADHDGVNNCKDECPNTLPGVKVSVAGCWIADVKFDNDKDIIKPQYFANLDETAKVIARHPELVIEIQGHTSQTGGYKHNIDLSNRRAIAVKNYLFHNKKLPNITTQGYGWSHPIDTNETAEGQANNRRVELQINTN